jgi:hypothetical protein
MGNRELAERFIASLEARDWDAWAGLLHPAVVYEIPQSRERIRGRDRYLRFNREYPGDWHLRPKVTIADERHGVVWFEWLLDGRAADAMAFFEFADGLITRVTDFWPEPYEPPPGREHLVERWLPAAAQRELTQPQSRAHVLLRQRSSWFNIYSLMMTLTRYIVHWSAGESEPRRLGRAGVSLSSGCRCDRRLSTRQPG